MGEETSKWERVWLRMSRGPWRPDFSVYVMGLTGASSLQDYLDNGQVSGQPEGQLRLYAGLGSKLPNMGASGTINQFQGDVEKGTLSIIEAAIQCEDPI
jgi:hypothetical protein